MHHLHLAPLGLALALSGTALASDLEYQSAELEADEPLEISFSMSSEWHESDNLDYRPLDESSDQAILDSDDRRSFAYNSLHAKVGYQIDDRTRAVVGLSHRGHWGNDALGGASPWGGWVYFSDAYVEYALTDGEHAPRITVGRQYFSLGGLGEGREYVLSDTLDMVRADFALGDLGTLTLIPMNVVSMASAEVEPQLLSVSEGTPSTFSFKGDLLHKRAGGLLVLDGLTDGLDARAYAFYTDIGALGSGADITYDGLLGNFADNDWVLNAGLRASYEAGPVTPWLSFDMSTGIDRKELVAQDVNADGMAFGGGVGLDLTDEDTGDGLEAKASYFMAQGPTYTKNGMEYSHGYVSMKGKHVGGTLYNRYMGYHPSAYVGSYGVSLKPHSLYRVSGTQVISAQAGYTVGGFEAELGWWWLTDTGLSDVDFDNVDALTPPYGYSREAFAAEERLGKSLGHELDLGLSYALSDHVALNLNGAVILPGEYWSIEVARVAGGSNTVLGGDAMPWAVGGGTEVRF